jgi:hypothetical protein
VCFQPSPVAVSFIPIGDSQQNALSISIKPPHRRQQLTRTPLA